MGCAGSQTTLLSALRPEALGPLSQVPQVATPVGPQCPSPSDPGCRGWMGSTALTSHHGPGVKQKPATVGLSLAVPSTFPARSALAPPPSRFSCELPLPPLRICFWEAARERPPEDRRDGAARTHAHTHAPVPAVVPECWLCAWRDSQFSVLGTEP